MGVWSTGFGNGYETNNVEEILEFCLKTYRGLALPPTDKDRMSLDTNAPNDAALPMIIGIDGRSGSGKTRLSELLEQSLSAEGIGVRVLNLDSIYPGWDGLEEARKRGRKSRGACATASPPATGSGIGTRMRPAPNTRSTPPRKP